MWCKVHELLRTSGNSLSFLELLLLQATGSGLLVFGDREKEFVVTFTHRLNMELDLQSLLGLHDTAVPIGWDPPPPAFGLIYEGAIGQPR